MIYLANMMISHSYLKLPEGTKQLLIGMILKKWSPVVILGVDMALISLVDWAITPANQENKSFGRLFQWDVSYLSLFYSCLGFVNIHGIIYQQDLL